MDILDLIIWILAVLGGLSMLRGAISLYKGLCYLDESIQKSRKEQMK